MYYSAIFNHWGKIVLILIIIFCICNFDTSMIVCYCDLKVLVLISTGHYGSFCVPLRTKKDYITFWSKQRHQKAKTGGEDSKDLDGICIFAR